MNRVAFGTPRRQQGTERYHNSNGILCTVALTNLRGTKRCVHASKISGSVFVKEDTCSACCFSKAFTWRIFS